MRITALKLMGGVCAMAALGLSAAGPAYAQRSQDRIIIPVQAGIPGVDTVGLTQLNMRVLSMLVDDQLYDYDQATGTHIPAVAESHTFVDDTTLDITLREGVFFHDGTELTADDVVYTLETLLMPEYAYTPHNQRLTTWLESVEKIDDRTVRLHFLQPYPFFEFDLANNAPLRRVDEMNPGGIMETLNGLGPYRVVSFSPDEVVLELFDDYYEAGPRVASIRHMVLRNMPDWGTQQAEIISGAAHLLWDIPLDVAQSLASYPTIDFTSGVSYGLFYVGLNPDENRAHNPAADIRVRQAIAHAIDKQSIIDNLLDPDTIPLETFCHPDNFGCTLDAPTYDYDPDRARELLAEAGYPDGLQLEWWSARDQQITEAIAGNLGEVGIQVSLNMVRQQTLEESRGNREMVAYSAPWRNSGNPDVYTLLSQWAHSSSRRSLLDDSELDALIDAAGAASDLEGRAALFAEAIQLIGEEAYIIPLFSVGLYGLVSSDLEFDPPLDGNVPRFYQTRWR